MVLLALLASGAGATVVLRVWSDGGRETTASSAPPKAEPPAAPPKAEPPAAPPKAEPPAAPPKAEPPAHLVAPAKEPPASPAPIPANSAPPTAAGARAPAPVSGPAELQPPLKLGLRRFVETEGDHAVLVHRVVAIDATGRAYVAEVARRTLAPDDHPGSLEGKALEPQPEFASSTERAGVVFEDALQLGGEPRGVRVSRGARGVVVDVQESPTAGAGGEVTSSWRTSLTLPLAQGARLRGAPLARGRYQE
jgi:hypothetical protein